MTISISFWNFTSYALCQNILLCFKLWDTLFGKTAILINNGDILNSTGLTFDLKSHYHIYWNLLSTYRRKNIVTYRSAIAANWCLNCTAKQHYCKHTSWSSLSTDRPTIGYIGYIVYTAKQLNSFVLNSWNRQTKMATYRLAIAAHFLKLVVNRPTDQHG